MNLKKLFLILLSMIVMIAVSAMPALAADFGFDFTIGTMANPELGISSADIGSETVELDNLMVYGFQEYLVFGKLRTGIELQAMDLSLYESEDLNIGVNGTYFGVFADYRILSWLGVGLGCGQVGDVFGKKAYLVFNVPDNEEVKLYVGYSDFSKTIDPPDPSLDPINLGVYGWTVGLGLKF